MQHAWELRNAYTILVGMPEGKRPLGRPRWRSEDNIRIGIKTIRWELVDGILPTCCLQIIM